MMTDAELDAIEAGKDGRHADAMRAIGRMAADVEILLAEVRRLRALVDELTADALFRDAPEKPGDKV